MYCSNIKKIIRKIILSEYKVQKMRYIQTKYWENIISKKKLDP